MLTEELLKKYFVDIINFFVPFRLIIPQPIIKKIPFLRSTEDERFYRVLSKYRGKGIDIGCGANRMIKKYRASGNDGIGIDVYPWEGADLIVIKNTDCLHFETESFDCASFVASLNHIPNRVEVLKEVYRILKPGGLLIITNLTPFVSLIWHKIAFWDIDQKVRGIKEVEVYGFTDKKLKKMVSNEGFVLVKKCSFM